MSSNGDCTCGELIVAGKRVPPPRFHDCDYVRARNRLIPEAERIADSKVATVKKASEDGGESFKKWTRALSGAMNELARPLLNGPAESVSPR